MRASQRERMNQEAADASQSGVVPIMGLSVLVFMVAAIVRLIL